jgi:protein O-GlcNAc transferase
MQAIAEYEECSRLCPENANASQNRLLALNYIKHGETARVCAEHARWGREHQARVAPLQAADPREWPEAAGRRLRVGYVSPDLHRHSVSYFAEAPVLHHDRSNVEVRLWAARCQNAADYPVRLAADYPVRLACWR